MNKEILIFKKNINSNIGKLNAYSDGVSIIGLYFTHNDFFKRTIKNKNIKILTKNLEIFKVLEIQLKEYFLKKRKNFKIPIKYNGTAFQKKAWTELLQIPYGKTQSYSEQAKKMKTKAIRAIGSANGKNPIVILIPCHRVIRQNGSIGGYSGGIKIKANLLEIEQTQASQTKSL